MVGNRVVTDLSEKKLEEYYRRILKLCLFYLKNSEEAEDIAQDIFVKVFEKIKGFREESNLYTWIYRISINTLNNYLKRKKIVDFISLDSKKESRKKLFGEDGNDPAFIAEQENERSRRLEILESSLRKLSSRERTAFYLYHYEKLKQKRIAEIMNTSVSAVESLIFKGMKKIKKFLA